MFLVSQRIICTVCTFFMMLYGLICGINGNDTIAKYKDKVAAVAYQNDYDTALPQTEMYNIISDFFAEPLPDGKTEKKVIILGYDGCRADTLSLMNDENPSAITRIQGDDGSLLLSYCGGVNYPAINVQDTSTAPGWASMLTGKWGKETGVTGNSVVKNSDCPTLLTTLVTDGKADSSAFYVSWNGHFVDDDSTYILERKDAEEKGLPITFSDADDDDGTLANILADVTKADCSDFIFTIFEYCDHYGHDTGFCPDLPDQQKAFYEQEDAACKVLDAIEARPTYDTEDWLIIATSDHGGYNTGHGAMTIMERMTFIASNRPIAVDEDSTKLTDIGYGVDTVAKYNKKVAKVAYENTLETALPQTEMYNIISDFFQADLPEGKTEKKVIVLGYDGCRADALSLMNSKKQSAITRVKDEGGNLILSYSGGVNYPAINVQQTSTAPGWCSMLTGKWGSETGITGNSIVKSNDYPTLLTTLVTDGIVDSSAFYVSWDGHFVDKKSTYSIERNTAEEKGLPITFSDADDDDGTLANILADVNKADCSDFIFTIFEYCDHAGHSKGFCTDLSAQKQAFYDSEVAGCAILDAIEARPTYDTEDWLIIVTSDHGGFGLTHGGVTIMERMTFIASNQPILDK